MLRETAKTLTDGSVFFLILEKTSSSFVSRSFSRTFDRIVTTAGGMFWGETTSPYANSPSSLFA